MPPNQNENIELIRQIQNNNHFAFRRFFDHYKHKVFNFALKFVLEKDHAEEITQIVFIKFWENRKKIACNSSLDTYLYVLAKNACIDFLRKVANDRRFRERFIDYYKTLEKSPDKLFDYNELLANTEKVIAQLPPKQQKVYLMAKIDKKSYDEIAQLMNISKNTVKTQLKIASAYVRKNLVKNYGTLISILFIFKIIR